MPAFKISNPLKSLDLTSLDLRQINLRQLNLRQLNLGGAVAPAAKVLRDSAFVVVGVGVIAAQRVNARRYDLQQRLNDVLPGVRNEAQATAQRVFDEAGAKVRSVLARRKNIATSESNA